MRKFKVCTLILSLFVICCMCACGSTNDFSDKIKVVFELEGGKFQNSEMPVTYYYNYDETNQTKIYDPETGNAVTIAEAISSKNPEYLIITLGLNNGASYYSEDQFKQCYRILLNSVFEASSETVVILQSLFPVAEACKISVYTPERLSLCNSWICDLATEYGIKYLDTFSILSNEQGYLKPEYDNGGDGIHLNAEGLQAVVQYIRTHGYCEEGGSLS